MHGAGPGGMMRPGGRPANAGARAARRPRSSDRSPSDQLQLETIQLSANPREWMLLVGIIERLRIDVLYGPGYVTTYTNLGWPGAGRPPPRLKLPSGREPQTSGDVVIPR